ncbi:PEF-CTERM sorting domain-containing protein [uncultured Methanolobus sp.]|uniref:PEF-CTERM sorting domain-containing protein n=1 Tax=uncultured Methanolobus sp. TaxID=218300 RepID=UPI0029C90667|nr:PEF-CTERM sorting domain-containing protein [uncultured Methanolobus sp.]
MKKLLIMLAIASIFLMGTASAAYTVTLGYAEGGELPATAIVQQVGETVNYSVIVDDQFMGTNVSFGVVAEDVGLDIEIIETGIFEVTSVPFTVNNAISVTIDESVPQGTVLIGTVGVFLEDGTQVAVVSVVPRASVSQDFKANIPEFPTIALPVAAILGLAFFMQRRKEE